MHKIFFSNRPLFITSKISGELEDLSHNPATILIDEFDAHTVSTMIHEMQQPDVYAGIFLHEDEDAVMEAFKNKLVLIKAAGGLVHTKDNDLLLIFRLGKWDLPKGKLDEGEDMEACALREMDEETGLKNVQIEKPLCITYHTYHQDGRHILKESHWFLMHSKKQNDLTPQTEEDIEKCEWVAIDKLSGYMDNMHASIKDVVHAGTELLKPART